MKKKGADKIKLTISSCIGVLLLIGMLWYVGVDALLAVIGQVSLLWLVLVVLVVSVPYLIRAWRWGMLLTPVKRSLKMSNMFWSIMVGFLVNTVIPIRLGEFIRAYILSGKEKIGVAPSFSSIVVERTLDLLGLLTIGLVALLILPSDASIPSWFIDTFKAVAVLLVVILVALVLGTRREQAVMRLVDRIAHPLSFWPKGKERILSVVKGLIDGAKAVSHNPRILMQTIIPTYGIWLLQLLSAFFIFNAFSYVAPLALILIGAVIIWFTFILPAPPGYIGTFEAYWLIVFLGLGLTEVEQLLAMGLVYHLISVAVTVILGSIGIVWLGLSFDEVFRIRRPSKT